jgi:hypothetical protein
MADLRAGLVSTLIGGQKFNSPKDPLSHKEVI